MTDAVRVDLADGSAACGEPAGGVVGFEVSDEGGGSCAGVDECPESSLKEFGFAGAGTRDEVEDEHGRRFESTAKAASKLVVLLQDALAQLYDPGGHTFSSTSSISIESISNSRPWRMSDKGSSQRGQRKLCRLAISTS